MRIIASIIMILGLLVAIGGVFGLVAGAPSGIVRLIIGAALIGVAVLIKPKAKPAARPE